MSADVCWRLAPNATSSGSRTVVGCSRSASEARSLPLRVQRLQQQRQQSPSRRLKRWPRCAAVVHGAWCFEGPCGNLTLSQPGILDNHQQKKAGKTHLRWRRKCWKQPKRKPKRGSSLDCIPRLMGQLIDTRVSPVNSAPTIPKAFMHEGKC